jgi:hypothetical protein
MDPFEMLKAMDMDLGDIDMKAMVEEAMNVRTPPSLLPPSLPPSTHLTTLFSSFLTTKQSPEVLAMMEDPALLKKALRESPLFENLPGLDK